MSDSDQNDLREIFATVLAGQKQLARMSASCFDKCVNYPVIQPVRCTYHKRSVHRIGPNQNEAAVVSFSESEAHVPLLRDPVAEAPFRNQQEGETPELYSLEDLHPVPDPLKYLDEMPLNTELLERAAADLWSALVEVKILVEADEEMPAPIKDHYRQALSLHLQETSAISDELNGIEDDSTPEVNNRMQEMLTLIKGGFELESAVRDEINLGFSEEPVPLETQQLEENSVWIASEPSERSIDIRTDQRHQLQEVTSENVAAGDASTAIPLQSDEAPVMTPYDELSPRNEEGIGEAGSLPSSDYNSDDADDSSWDDSEEFYEDEEDEEELEGSLPPPPSGPGGGILEGADDGVSLVQEAESDDTLGNTIKDQLHKIINPTPETVQNRESDDKAIVQEKDQFGNEEASGRASDAIRISVAMLCIVIALL